MARVAPSSAESKYQVGSPDEKQLIQADTMKPSSAPDSKTGEQISSRRERNTVGCFRDKLSPPGFISPNSKFQSMWDIVLFLLLLWVMVVTPFEVCFMEPLSVTDFLFWANRLLDLLFLLDMVLQFWSIPAELANSTNDSMSGPPEYSNPAALKAEIKRQYFAGWFWVDLLALLPYGLIAYLIEKMIEGEGVGMIRLIRVVRLLRLGKVLRVFRTSQVIARYDDRVGISFVKLRIVKYVCILLLAAHWLACALRLVVEIEGNETDNWMYAYWGTMDKEPVEVYNVALYWSIMTMTSVGYGDVLPQTDAEILVTTLVMLFGAGVLAFMLGSITSLIATLDLQESEYYKLRDQLNEFMVTHDIEDRISYKVRHYVRSQYENGTLFDWSKVLGRLSEQLQGEITNSIQQKWLYTKLQGNSCFQTASTEAIVALADEIVPRSFGAKESLIQPGDPTNFMFLIQRGIVLCEGKFIRAGNIAGQDMLYFAVHDAENLDEFSNLVLSPSRVRRGGPAIKEDLSIASLQTKMKEIEARESEVAKEIIAEVRESRTQDDSKKARRAGKRPKPRGLFSVREYSARTLCFTIANELKKEAFVRILVRFPELLRDCRRVVYRKLLQQHVKAYTIAYQAVNADPNDVHKSEISLDNTLAIWYARKMRKLEEYSAAVNFHQIVTCQRMIRGRLSRLKSKHLRKTKNNGQHRSEMLHEVLKTLQRIEQRVEGLERHKNRKDKRKEVKELASPASDVAVDQAEFETEWRKMKSEYKQRLWEEMNNRSVDRPTALLSQSQRDDNP